VILTKYKHACFTLAHNGETLVVDPGKFADDFTPDNTITAIIITHEHFDHFDIPTVEAILQQSPDAIIYAHPTITQQLSGMNVVAVNAGDVRQAGSFKLEFFGGQHAVIHENLPPIPNLGVLINNSIYYPGDSFIAPQKSIPVLALPVTAPWLKISETLALLKSVSPRLAFPTHDAIASDEGKLIVDTMISAEAKKLGIDYQRLTEPIEI